MEAAFEEEIGGETADASADNDNLHDAGCMQ